MNITQRILTGAVAALALALPLAPLASAAPAVSFTSAESQFLRDEASIGITPSLVPQAPSEASEDVRQPLVDLGWAVEKDVTEQGVAAARVAVVLFQMAPRRIVGGITVDQAVDTVSFALSDLRGTSPSPGGMFGPSAPVSPDSTDARTPQTIA